MQDHWGDWHERSHPHERKCLLAAAIVYQATGAAIYVHTYPWGRAGLEAARRLIAEGVEPKKIVICHVDVDFDLDYLRSPLDLGVCLGFDNFGKEFYIDADDRGFAGGIFARDLERVQVIRQLVARGHEGIPQSAIDTFLIHNPRRLLSPMRQ